MTERLYYHDAGRLAFDAQLVGYGESERHVVLDASAFYPTSGGQPHDTGTLNGVRVLDVIDDDARVIHLLESPLPLGAVHGEIDAVRRHDHMQQHTAQHLLSAIAADRFGWETASVHFAAEHSTIEFATAIASDGALRELERAANAAVASAHPVVVTFEAADDAIARGLRKPPARSGEIRVVTIEGIDRSACGGTHVASTAAIGAIVVRGVEKVRGHVRVGFLAGARVIERLHAREALLAALAETASCAVDELTTITARRQADLKGVRERVDELEREVAVTRLHALVAAAAAGPDGIRRAVHRSEADSATLLRAMAQGVAPLERLLFVATSSTPPTVLVAVSGDSGLDAGALLKTAFAAVGGRGGGSPKMAQGTVSDPADLGRVVELLTAPA